MRSSASLLSVFGTLFLVLFVFGALFAQDLNQQKQDFIKQVRAIDKQLADNPTTQEYEDFIKQRQELEAKIKKINAEMMADVETAQKINAVKKAYNDANNARKLENYQEALANYDKAISLDANFYKAYYGKGLTLKKLRKFNEALAAYQGALQQNPAYTEASVALGKIYGQIGQPDNAIKVYKAAVENSPGAYKAYYGLGAVYLNKKKDYNKAALNFQKATQLNPNYDLAFLSLGVALTELNRSNEALIAFDNALNVTKRRKWHRPYYRKAVVYNKLGSYSKAKAAADQALQNKRNYAPAADQAGRASKELGQYQTAINYFKIAAKDRNWKRTADYEIDLIVNRDKYGGN